ncbi:hypothetical protein MEO43_13960 [Dolichospermum sp. ST_sed5]|nr:hypothetical protein [Dolichospermum sp. ST_sed7]MDD1466378.1 hypothetical protein [Dolichospermum sp. ST_sed5]
MGKFYRTVNIFCDYTRLIERNGIGRTAIEAEVEIKRLKTIFNLALDTTALPGVMRYISSGQDARTTRVS